METKTTFSFRISDAAYEVMKTILRNPDVTGPQINGQLCRVTQSHDVLLSIKSNFWTEYHRDELVSVRLCNDDSQDYVVMKSLMEAVETPVTT
jgi:hypothetical protein